MEEEGLKMKHLGTKTIETDRLTLRKFTLDDAEDLFNNWANDVEVAKFLTWPTHSNIEISKSLITMWVDKYNDDKYYQWCIELKENKQAIGSISVVNMNEKVASVEIGYCIGQKYWNKGITSEALAALIKFLFEEVKVNRIEARHDPNNPNSGKVMLKCGLQYEGTRRKADKNNMGIVDVALYGILADDYYSKRK